MTARLNDRELDHVLSAWFDEGPVAASQAAITGALARVPTVRQRSGMPRVLGVLRGSGHPILRFAAILTVTAALITAAAAIALMMAPDPAPIPPLPSAVSSPGPSASSPEPTPEEPPSAATGIGELSISGAVDMKGEWSFFPAEPSEVYPDLARYTFYRFDGTPCGCSGGAYLHLYLDPDGRYPETTPTGDQLIMRFGFPPFGVEQRAYINSHLSVAGECLANFVTFTETEIRATFECANVPSEVNDLVIHATGELSFDPREEMPPATE